MMSLWDALRMNMMISYQELVRTFLSSVMANPTMDEPPYEGWTPSMTQEGQEQTSSSSDLNFHDDIPF